MFCRFAAVLPAALACSLLTGWAVLPAEGAAFTNGGFELGAFDVADADHVMSLPVGSTLLNGWTTIGAELAWARNDNPYVGAGATDGGSFFLDLTGFHDASPYGGVTQTFDSVAGAAYSLGFDLVTQENSILYRSPIAATASAGATSQTFTFTAPPASSGVQFGHFELPFTATGSATTISLQGVLSAGGQFLGMDNVTLTVIPEPGAASLLIAGAATVAGLRRRRGLPPQ